MKKLLMNKRGFSKYKFLASQGIPLRSYIFAISILLVGSLFINAMFLVRNYNNNRVVTVIDGDSLELKDGRRVRLLGIDAPELGRCGAEDAKESLKTLALGKHVRLKNIVTDDYGRQLAHVIVEDIPTWISYLKWRFSGKSTPFPTPDPFINRYMVSHGFAKFAGGDTPYRDTLHLAREYAKQHKLGIYSDQCRGLSGQSGCDIKGNIRQGKKVYYVSTCSTYTQVIVDQSFGDQWFCSENEAMENRFVKAQTCF